MSAELSIILLNAVIIIMAYAWLYPKIASKKLKRIVFVDCAASGTALIIVANKYWGVDIEFGFLMYELNWFWFTLISYSVIEIPIAIWYFRTLRIKDDTGSNKGN